MTKLWLAATIVAFGVLACGSDAKDELSLRVTLTNGKVPESYRLVLDGRAVDCPGNRSCESLPRSAVGRSLTVKAPGSAFLDHVVGADELEQGVVRLELSPLEAFQSNANFRTGITEEEGARVFLDLAVSTETELGTVHSVKFYVEDLGGTPRVYFQNTKRHPLHYDFARLVLGVPGSREQFSARTYQGEDRPALAGTVLYYPDLTFESVAFGADVSAPLTFEFFPGDDLSPALALEAHRLLEERLQFGEFAGANHRLAYVPAGSDQEAELDAERASFRARDALFAQHVELYSGVEEQILNPGMAYGTLRLSTAAELETEVVSFRDILVLTRLPADLPLVGGTISEDLQTPLAHVNLAARARGTPNLALKRASSDPRIAPYLGKLVRFEVNQSGFSIEETTIDDAEAYWASLSHERLVPVADTDYVGLPEFQSLSFGDSVRVGVKAANLAVLRQLLGDLAPRGFAVPFSAYHRYMADNRVTAPLCVDAELDCLAEGRTDALCEAARARCDAGAEAAETFFEFADRFLVDPELATDSALREATLDAVRHLVRHGDVADDFAASLDSRVTQLFGTGQVRLRSSTNAEDLPGFSGAGLYESVSAEPDGDRRASRRIREVWSSVWLWRAFEERQFWNIDSGAVRMAVAVNAAIDDEAANGVLITKNLLTQGSAGHYVNVQLGEVEVANPEGDAVPEVFAIVPAPGQAVQVHRQRFSSLSPNQSLLSDAEIEALSDAADRVQSHFAPLYELSSSDLALDLEFKFYGPERRLLIKQARPYSRAGMVE